MTTKRPIPNTNEIGMYFHCARCLEQYEKEMPEMSRGDFQQLEIGYTKIGLQIWCRRHNMNIIHIDFEGQKHPANTSGAT